MDQSSTYYRAAISQAGRAVASLYFGIRFRLVSITPGRTGVHNNMRRDAALWEQLQGIQPGKKWTEVTKDRKVKFAVTILYTGPAALQRSGVISEMDSSTLEEINSLATALYPDEIERESLLTWCREQAEYIATEYWSQVQKVTAELQVVKKLTGKQVAALVAPTLQ